ncbi:MAG: transglycosylase SLT domain-containing protein [Holosporales bacterium]|jgi:hypothetical protein|nr:transglycosylase SLT domain-containing protein [Holosporales bacterium]
MKKSVARLLGGTRDRAARGGRCLMFLLLFANLFCHCFGAAADGKIDKATHDCKEIIHFFEKKYGIPQGLLAAIAAVESGRRLWAINMRRKSFYCRNLQEAMNVMSCAKGHPNVSIGYMQINWNVHKNSFKNLETAFTPYYNIKLAAQLLRKLYQRRGSWENAVRWYNPKNKKPNDLYLKHVKKFWTYEKAS